MPRSFFVMLERFIQAVFTDDAREEQPGDTRKRLKEKFAPGATRRMTQLGMLVGSVLREIDLEENDALVYASGYGESRTLETYLDSFPHPSPTMFQTSIHPSGAQQSLIGRHTSVREFLPLSGGNQLTAQAILAALLSPHQRVCLCGGEETATWLLENNAASDRSFALALLLSIEPPASAPLGKIELHEIDSSGTLSWTGFFDIVHRRESFDGTIAEGRRLRIVWL
jgi:hypothetical protein